MPRLHSIDASFLAGECDPAVVARVDDVVRANAAGKIRNAYVRSMGGVRVRPGMRVLESIDAREFAPVFDLPGTRIRAIVNPVVFADDGVRVVTLDQPAIIPPWPANERRADSVNLFRVDFGQVLPAGTTIRVRIRISPNAPAGFQQLLWWWEDDSDASSVISNGIALGSWRSGAGHDPARGAAADRIVLGNRVFEDYSHVLQSAADGIALRTMRWQPAGGNRPGVTGPDPTLYAVEVEGWSGEREVAPGQGGRPVARLLNATWFPGADFLLALYGVNATLLWPVGQDRLRLNPFGFRGYTGFTPEEVLSMRAVRTPSEVFLHSPVVGRAAWPPWRLFIDSGTAKIERLAINHYPVVERNGRDTRVLGRDLPPSLLAVTQGRLIVGGTAGAPSTLWLSRQDFPGEMYPPGAPGGRYQVRDSDGRGVLLADDAFIMQAGKSYNRWLEWHAGLRHVLFGTEGIAYLGEQALSATAPPEVRENSERGIKAGVPPLEIGTGRIVFVDASGRSVWLMTYANERQGYILTELSQVAPHLLDEPEDAVFYTGLPDGGTVVLIVNADGSIACCAVQPEEEWHAWSRWETDELLDVEPFAGSIWALTRRGDRERNLYIETFDPDLELDFCQVTADGTHAFSAFYQRWAAVLEMSDGDRIRLGMRQPETSRDVPLAERQASAAAVEDEMFTAQEVFEGVRSHLGGRSLEHPLTRRQYTADDVVRIQIGQPFEWELETLPFVKRTAQGTTFQQPTKTQECFVNCVDGHLRLPEGAALEAMLERYGDIEVDFSLNGERLDPIPRLFTDPAPKPLVGDAVALSHRFVNIVGWRQQNVVTLRGRVPCTISSVSRTVVA